MLLDFTIVTVEVSFLFSILHESRRRLSVVHFPLRRCSGHRHVQFSMRESKMSFVVFKVTLDKGPFVCNLTLSIQYMLFQRLVYWVISFRYLI